MVAEVEVVGELGTMTEGGGGGERRAGRGDCGGVGSPVGEMGGVVNSGEAEWLLE